MIALPQANNLPVEHLASSLGNVTNSYKFYWFLAILEDIRENQSRTILISDLLARMVSGVWYPANYFQLSFGRQDRLSQIAAQVRQYTSLSINSRRQEVVRAIQECLASDPSLARDIQSLGQYVPFRFLRPFLAQQLRGLNDWQVNRRTEELAAQVFADPQRLCIYRFVGQPASAIEIQRDWFEYLNRHLTILSGFCLWHLVKYLQKNNPNVPNIPNKLFEPAQRDLRKALAFWRLVFDIVGNLACIYSGQVIQKSSFSLDHFLPWRFVAHDLLWNIVPTPQSVNATKSDNLPDLNRYFEPFAQLQYHAVQAVIASVQANLLEDYMLLLGVSSVADIQDMPFQTFREKVHNAITPQFQIAANMGFSSHWSYA